MTTARALRGPFDYRLPEELREGVDVGSMLVVPFGGAQVLGVVVGPVRPQRGRRGEAARAAAGARARRARDLVALAEWVAAEYCSTLARALALVLPPGAARRLERAQAPRRPAAPAGAPLGAQIAPGAAAQRRTAGARCEPLRAALADAALRAAPAARRHRLGQDRGLPARRRRRARAGPRRDRAGARDRAHAADRRALLERFGDTVAVLHSRLTPGPALRRVAAAARGRGARVRRPALGRVRADRAARADRRRRGARRLLQARGRPALRRPRRRRASAPARRGALLLLGSATPRPESALAAGAPRACPPRVDGRPLPPVEVLDMRGQPQRPAPAHRAGARRGARERARQGDRAAQPPRLVELPLLPLLRAVWSCPDCDVALVLHRAERLLACHHCGHREPVPARCRTAPRPRSRATAPGTERLAARPRGALRRRRFPVFRLDADAVARRAARRPPSATARGAILRALRGGLQRAC